VTVHSYPSIELRSNAPAADFSIKMFIVSPSFMLPPSSSASPVHRVCIGLHHTLQTHVFGLRELVFSDGLTSDVCVLVGRALVEPLLLDAGAGVLANVDLTHLFSGLVRYERGVGVRRDTVAVGCRMPRAYTGLGNALQVLCQRSGKQYRGSRAYLNCRWQCQWLIG
jgi:hypothetical protein